MKQDHQLSLTRGINRWDLVLLFINSVIGAGIFGLPSKIFGLSGVYSLVAFIVCGAVVMVFILCMAEVSSQFDKTGGPYVYVLTSFGRLPAFITGWLLILSRIFNYATLVNLLVVYLSYFSETFSQPASRVICIVLISLILAYINHIGVKDSTRVSNILTIAKLLPLTVFIVVGLLNLQPALLEPAQPFQFSSFSTSVLLLVFAFGGFESMLINSGEIKQPQRNIPFALLVSAVIISIYYCLIQLVSIGTLPGLATSQKPLAEAAHGFMGQWGGSLIAAGALVSITGTLNVILLSGSRLPFALSVEKQLPPVLSYIHPKYRTPSWSLIAIFIAIVTVSLTWSFFTALAVASIIRVLIYLIMCASLIRLRKQEKPGKTYFKLRYGYSLAILGIVLSFWLLSASKWNEVLTVSVCILIGIVLFLFFNRSKREKSGEKGIKA